MRAYNNIRFIECPDILDIKTQGRKSSVGRTGRGGDRCIFRNSIFVGTKVSHNDRGYCAPRAKAATRRYLKHVDRAIDARFDRMAEGE